MTVTIHSQVIIYSHKLKCTGEQLTNPCNSLQVTCKPENTAANKQTKNKKERKKIKKERKEPLTF